MTNRYTAVYVVYKEAKKHHARCVNYTQNLSAGDKDSYIAPLTAALLAMVDLRCNKRGFDGYSVAIRTVRNDVRKKGFLVEW